MRRWAMFRPPELNQWVCEVSSSWVILVIINFSLWPVEGEIASICMTWLIVTEQLSAIRKELVLSAWEKDKCMGMWSKNNNVL